MGSGGQEKARGGSLAARRAAAAATTTAHAHEHANHANGGGGGVAVAVDFVYGLHPDSSTGGCVVQRAFEHDLRRSVGVVSVKAHVASDPASAESVFRLLQQQDGEGGGEDECSSRVLIIDGIALLFLRDRLHELRNYCDARRSRRVLAGFVHCPFSEPFYREEPWLRAALPDRMLLDKDGGGIRAEETRLFGLFHKIVAVGSPCRCLLTADYGVSDDAIVVLEPTFQTPAAAAAAAVNVRAADVDNGGGGVVDVSTKRAAKFVSVGTMCPRKGQLALIAALRAACARHPAELGGSTLYLVGGEGGDPAYAEAVKAAAVSDGAASSHGGDGKEGRLEVRLLGSLPHAQALETVENSDACLLNSCLESWAIAPVEAALRGVPVLTTRVGWLSQSLPQESTIWVGSAQAGQGHGHDGVAGGNGSGDGDGGGLASSADWEEALLQFARSRRRLKAEAKRAVPGLAERFGQAVAGSSRAQAVRQLLKETTGTGRDTHNTNGPSAGGVVSINNGPAAVASDQERVRSATMTNALACVFATCVSISGAGGAKGGLAALVAAQLLLLFNLAPPCSPANLVTMFRSFIPPAVLWLQAGSDFGQVAMADVAVFGVLFVALDMVDGFLARRSKAGPTLVGGALDVESDSIAVLFVSLAASRKAWFGGFIAGALRYLFVLATGARELPPSPIGPAGRLVAKFAALASVGALAASVGNGAVADGGIGGGGDVAAGGSSDEGGWAMMHGAGAAEGSSPFLCAAGVAVLCASFSIDFFQIWVLLPREAAAAEANAAAAAVAAAAAGTATNGEFGTGGSPVGRVEEVTTPGEVGNGDASKNRCYKAARRAAPFGG